MIVAGLVIFIVQSGRGVSEFVQYDRVETTLAVNSELCRGWRYLPKGSTDLDDAVRLRVWSPTTGFLVLESETLPGEVVRTTVWTPKGKVLQQTEFDLLGGSSSTLKPPWLWGAKDQTAPSAPAEYWSAPGS